MLALVRCIWKMHFCTHFSVLRTPVDDNENGYKRIPEHLYAFLLPLFPTDMFGFFFKSSYRVQNCPLPSPSLSRLWTRDLWLDLLRHIISTMSTKTKRSSEYTNKQVRIWRQKEPAISTPKSPTYLLKILQTHPTIPVSSRYSFLTCIFQ